MFTIYHNPRCSKSRQTLELLNNAKVELDIVEYLKEVPSVEVLKDTINKLGLSNIRDLMRTKETIYKELELNRNEITEDQLLQAMVENPKLIERPIVIKGDKAVIGRPPENVNELIS